MKTINISTKLKFSKNLISLAVAILVSFYLLPLHAQAVRGDKEKKVILLKNKMVYFDEADALFGKRTDVKKAHPTFKVIGKVNTINITQNLNEGDNVIHKMKSGHSLFVTVKNGKINKFGSVHKGDISTSLSSKKVSKKTYLSCTKICLDLKDKDTPECWITCEVVDSSSDHNAQIEGQLKKPNSPTPAGVPIPYPNSNKQGNNYPL